MKKLLKKIGENIAALALIVGVVSTSQACHFFLNQPEVPEEMKEFLNNKKLK